MLSEPNHEHEFKVVITMDGALNEEGFICDFRAVKRLFKRLIGSRLEGTNLDDRFAFPTSENLAVWIWRELDRFFPLYSIEVREKPHSGAVYYGPEREKVAK
jgi:6-pyruvoyltetrahydropterin/6-carboxytetrahydropterin synthase